MKGKLYSYIRFSTPKQAQGDSYRRQLELAERYAKQHKLELSEIYDSGISAFKGKNVSEKGALGKLLRLIEDGKIETGTILVENLDRISRQEVSETIPIFMNIINSGFTIVTLSDGERIYTKESINKNPMDLMYSIMVFARGNEESQAKSTRLKSIYAQKRLNTIKNGGIYKIKSIPSWLKIEDEKFIVIEENASKIRYIFQLYLEGLGIQKIIRRLKKENISSLTGKNFHFKTIQVHILRNPAVIGTVCIDGTEIQDYYPPIIDEATFLKVHELMKKRHRKGRPPVHKDLVFSGLLKCGVCSRSLYIINKTDKNRYYPVMRCSSFRHGEKCRNKQWGYDKFVTIFHDLIDIDFSLLPQATPIEDKRPKIRKEISDIEGRIGKLSQAIQIAPDVSELSYQIADLQKKKEAAQEALKEAERDSLGAKDTNLTGLDLSDPSVISDAIHTQFESIRIRSVGPCRYGYGLENYIIRKIEAITHTGYRIAWIFFDTGTRQKLYPSKLVLENQKGSTLDLKEGKNLQTNPLLKNLILNFQLDSDPDEIWRFEHKGNSIHITTQKYGN